MSSLFEAYITNLGKYNEGRIVGETLKFPATTEEVQSLLKNIGVDGVRYEEFFITAFDGDVMGLYDYLTEYENLDELNHLAHLISELDSDEIETLEAVLNKGDHTSSVADIINLVHNLDCYELHPGVTADETLGRINKSCHTALKYVQKYFTGTKWFVEGDIKGCFDNVDHHVLIDILRKRIADEHFIGLLWKFLKAGYLPRRSLTRPPRWGGPC